MNFKDKRRERKIEKYTAKTVEFLNLWENEEYTQKGTRIFYESNQKSCDITVFYDAKRSANHVAKNFKSLMQYREDYESDQFSFYPTK